MLETTVRESIRAAVDDEASTLAARVEARVAYDGDVSVTVDPDGFARQYARRGLSSLLDRAVTAAHRTLHATVVGTGRPRERFSTLATAQSRILATATLLLAARCGSQALAAECDLVTAKQWRTADEAVCPVHGTVSRKRPVQRCFGEPAVGGTAYVVGERTPLACSCIQRVVLGPVARTDPRALATSDGVTVKQGGDPVKPLSDREWEVYRAHARPDETFVDLLRRFERTRSVRGGARELGVAKKTLYRWFDAYLVDFDRYSGR
ncbi:hypothetical protein ACFQMA_13920 [Halosimplex aquaticum]|uniref:Uncharacterized protein n=1 Tax=Halosimplex aquaticum TaxID=3026162 RepID=A0ABD5Y100_9EURY|nr:hypothetical protein [Halosimplex aquaticum]